MKKVLFMISVAAVAFTSCSNESTEYVGSGPEQKEIAFSPLVQKATRAAVDGSTFPTTSTMQVAAYDATAGENYFAATEFSHATSTWKGGKYWPLTAATINFLAYTGFTAGTATWNATNPASAVELAMGDNRSAQNDLMYACGTGTVEQIGNGLTFPENVPMVFKHAQAWIKFTVQAGDATTASALTINKITLNSVSCQGTYTVTHTNWDQTKAARDADASKNGSVAGVWSAYNTYAGNIDAAPAGGYSTLNTSVQDFASLMVVPNQGMASFTINYTVDGNTYNYTYTPASTTLAQATKYIYNIKLTLHEIEIVPSVTDWAGGGSEYVDIPNMAFDASSATTGTYTTPASTAGTYSVTINGLTSDTYTVSTPTGIITNIATSDISSAVTSMTIYFTVNGTAGSNNITVTDSGSNVDFTLTVTTP